MNLTPVNDLEETPGLSADSQAPVAFFPESSVFENLAHMGDELVTRTELPNEIRIMTYKLGRIIVQTATHLIVIHPGRAFKLLRRYEPARILYRTIRTKYNAAHQEYQHYLDGLSPAERHLKQLEVKAWLAQQKIKAE